jgi:hypothetical protein
MSGGDALSTRLNGESTALKARGWRIYKAAGRIWSCAKLPPRYLLT